jgi:DNA-directed RNA polymerase specialized sigma subunit
MNNLKYFSQQNYELKKEIERGVIHIPANHKDLEYNYVGLDEVEGFESQSSEFRGFEIEDMSKELNLVMGSILTPIERCVIELAFGLSGDREMSVNEIGTELMYTNTHISSTKKRAMKKLQNYFLN